MWAVGPPSGLGPPRSSRAATSRHTQGKVVAKIPHPSRIKNAHRFGNTSKARSRGSNEQARGPKLATNRCRRTIPCRRPCRNKYSHTAPQTRHGRQPRGAARHQAQAEPLADFQRERPAVPRTSCLSETRRVPSPSPCPWAGIPAQIRSSTCSTTPTTPPRRRDRRHRGGRGRASRRCRAATACGAFAWKPPARRRTKGRCIAAPAGAAAGSAGPSRRAAASARPRRRMAGSGIRPASSAAARSAMAPPSPTLAWP